MCTVYTLEKLLCVQWRLGLTGTLVSMCREMRFVVKASPMNVLFINLL